MTLEGVGSTISKVSHFLGSSTTFEIGALDGEVDTTSVSHSREEGREEGEEGDTST